MNHGSFTNTIAWMRRRFDIDPTDHVSQLFAPAFDAAALDTWTALTAGARLCVADNEQRRDPVLLCRWLTDAAITVAGLPTGLGEAVLTLPEINQTRLRAMILGGDRLHWRAPHTVAFEVVNGYGPAEATIVTTSATIVTTSDHNPPPIGHPVDNVRVYVLDTGLRMVPDDIPGELYIAGDCLTDGYLDRPGQTALSYLADPHGPGRMYRTGDRVRWHDGELEFLGRTDDQLSVRGYRLEARELESVMRQFPGVTHAAAIVRDQRLLGYVVAPNAEQQPHLIEDLRAFLTQRLPHHAVPDTLTTLSQLPLTAHGKLDRDRLPIPITRAITFTAPTTPLEHTLLRIFRDHLGRDDLGTHDDFFDTGGHSLLAMKVAATLTATLGTRVTVRTLFEAPTVAALATRLPPNQEQTP